MNNCLAQTGTFEDWSVALPMPGALARAMQETLAPPVTFHDSQIEAYGRTMPREAVGGDLLDLVAEHGDVISYVADVSGHGMPAGVLMGMVKTAARYGLMFGQDLPALLEGINRVLPAVKEPNMYATFAGLRFHGTREAEYVVAGHLPLLHYRSAHHDVVRCSMEQFPLGLFPIVTYTSCRVQYDPGDLFAIVTDGVVETSDALDEEFGLQRLEHILCAYAGRPLPEIFDAACAAVNCFGTQRDDQTIMLVRAQPAKIIS